MQKIKRFKAIVEYDGGFFHGFQRQENGVTVQGILEQALLNLTQEEICIMGAGRTDQGVHALGQVVHFETTKDIAPTQLQKALNFHIRSSLKKAVDLSQMRLWLPLCVHHVEEVPKIFHARFSALFRSYLYKIRNAQTPSPLEHNRSWHVYPPLNLEAMEEACQLFIGTHDFSAFRSSHCQSLRTRRSIHSFSCAREDNMLLFRVKARSFLHNQVRIMIGTLKKVGEGKIPVEHITKCLTSGNRSLAGVTAPAHGLYFFSVEYPNHS